MKASETTKSIVGMAEEMETDNWSERKKTLHHNCCALLPRIARMEKQKTVTIEMLRKIAKGLGVSIKDLMNNNQNRQ